MSDTPYQVVTDDERRELALGIGISRALVDLVLAGRSSPRYGRPGKHLLDTKHMCAESDRAGGDLMGMMLAQRMARALDLDDIFHGEDITYVRVPGTEHDGSPCTVLRPTLMPAALIRTAVRTGLYLPDRSNINCQGERKNWYAFASGWQRFDTSASQWLAVADIAYWNHRYERAADGVTPTPEWELDGDQMLIACAEALCAKRALGDLLEGVPCVAFTMHIDQDTDYLKRRMETFTRHADLADRLRQAP